MKKFFTALLVGIVIVLLVGFLWGGLIYGVVNVCFDYPLSFWKEMLLGIIFQTALLFIRTTFKGRD